MSLPWWQWGFRDVSRPVRAVREWLLGSRPGSGLPTVRDPCFLAARDQPPPRLPPGPHQRLARNYYCDRDGPREVQPPLVIVDCCEEAKEAAQLQERCGGGVRPGCSCPDLMEPAVEGHWERR